MVENVVINRKKYEKNVEIRKIAYEYELYNAINNTRDGWKRLMGAIPRNLDDLESDQPINNYKYKIDDMRYTKFIFIHYSKSLLFNLYF